MLKNFLRLSDNSDRTFEKIGQKIPYYAVKDPKYRARQIEGEVREKFFISGEEHIDQLFAFLEKQFPNFQKRKALEFGCGVGRMLIPLAKRFQFVTGADVSPSMLQESERNLNEQKISNVNLVLSDDSLSRLSPGFDFIHTFTVIQHIPIARGEKIISRLIDLLEKNGVAALHLTYARQASLVRKGINAARKYFKPFHAFVNVCQGDPLNEPFMQMNNYNVNRLLQIIYSKGIENVILQPTQHGTHSGVIVFFQRAPD